MQKWSVGTKGTTSSTVPIPELTGGHVTVLVHAITLLPLDVRKSGYSFAGTVIASFENTAWPIGAKVWGVNANYTENEITAHITVPEWAIHKMKTNLTFAESATLGGPALLACHALQVAALPGTGKPRVFIHGGHTAIGTFAIQASRVMKCEVEVTCPQSFVTQCKDLGATAIVELTEGISAGVTLSSFRGRYERNFHLVIDCIGTDPSLYDNIEKFTHEHSKYITIRDKAVSWTGFFKRLTTSVPRDYLYLSNPLTAENAARSLALVNNLLGHANFVGIEIQSEHGVEDLATAFQAVDSATGFGCVIIEVTAPDSEEVEVQLRLAKQTPQPYVEEVQKGSRRSLNLSLRRNDDAKHFSLE